MKYFVITLLILSVTISAFAELTTTDLENIQKIVEKSETRMKEYVDIKIDAFEKNVDKQFGHVSGKINILTAIICALIGLIGVVIALPAWANRKDENDLKKQVETLKQDMEMLKQHIL